MTTWLRNNKLVIAGIVSGAIAGFLYWKLVGCNTGSCAITSKWHNSTVYGALIGGLLFSLFKRPAGDRQGKEENRK